MALIVETGTGDTAADSFCSVADATAYHAAMGNTAWAALASDTVREQLLRRATVFMEGLYRDRYAGFRKSTTQALCWPRSLVPMKDAPISVSGHFFSYYDNSSVPVAVKNACAELALRAATNDLLADQKRAKLSVNVGGIATTYDRFSPQTVQYKAIDAMLRPYLKGVDSNVEMVRA